MHHLLRRSKTPHVPGTMYRCVPSKSHVTTAIISQSSVQLLVFVMETHSVVCEVG